MKPATNNQQPSTPPTWANRFLKWYCRPELLDEIQGDAFELYQREAKTSKRKANWKFVWNVIRFFRWRNIIKKRFIIKSSIMDMLKSYLLSGFRNMVRNGATSFINIAGLSIAIGCAVTIFILEDSFYDLDAMHTKGDDIALVVNHVKNGDDVERWARSPYPLTEMLRNNTAVEKIAAAGKLPANVRVGNEVFTEQIMFVDPDFMHMFDFKLLSGNRAALNRKDQLMISQAMAIKYFGNDQAVGQSMSIKFNDKDKFDFTIGAVMEDTPANSSMYFDFLVPGAVWRSMNPNAHEEWADFKGSIFVLKKPGTNWSAFDADFKNYQKLQNQANTSRPVQHVEMIPLKEVAIESWNISGSLSWSNAPSAMVSIAIIGLFLILLACFNYMNVAVASVSTRLKEIGVRKVIGSGKKEIILQFMMENIVLCFVALLVGTALAYLFIIPGFNQTFPVKVDFAISSWQMALAFFAGLLLFVALLSGAYPSMYVAAFNAVKILKGKEKFGNKSLFSRALLTVQFTLSIIIMVGSLMFVSASNYLENIDWGYAKEETVQVKLQSAKQYEELRSLIAGNQHIVTMAGGARHIGVTSRQADIIYEGKEHSARVFPVGMHYLEAMNMRFKSGRTFDESIESDKVESTIVNEMLVKQMGWSEPIGQEFMLDSVKRYVVGVVEDFYFSSFFNAIEPVAFVMTPADQFSFMVVKAEAGKAGEVEIALKNAWKKVAPDDPSAVSLQSTVFDGFLQGNRGNNKVMLFVAIVSVLLTAMGLYGLVSYNITRRLKEFSVRKVFGASVVTIFRLMSRDYIYMVGIAFLFGAPVGAYLMNMLITGIYPMHIDISSWPYVTAMALMVGLVSVTVLSQFRRVTQENPTETLRME